MGMSVVDTINYWRRCKGGPKKTALVFKDGSHLPTDLDNNTEYAAAQLRCNEAIGLVLLIPAKNRWALEFAGPERYSRGREDHPTMEEAVKALLVDWQTAHSEYAALIADPAKHLERELKNHDWTYHFSDDHANWSAGQRHWEKIKGLLQKLPDNEARDLWAAHAPEGYDYPFGKTPDKPQ